MFSCTVIYDSCTLYSAHLRDLLMHLALTDLFKAKWTEAIHMEWIRNLLKNRSDLSLNKLEKVKKLMNVHIRDCLVESYETLIPNLVLPDPNDRHVLAAAIHVNASFIVTYNTKDFPNNILNQYGIEAQHPDEFVSNLIKMSPGTICTTVHRLIKNFKSPTINLNDYLTILERQRLPQTASLLRMHMI